MKNGYLNLAVTGNAPSPGSCCTLFSFWHVDAGGKYHIRRSSGGAFPVLIRTLSGTGRIVLDDGQTLYAEADGALLLDNSRIREYQSSGGSWHFFWFEFAGDSPPLPAGEALNIPVRNWEIPFLEQLKMLLTQPGTEGPRAASELFGGYLHALKAEIPGGRRRDRRITDSLEFVSRNLPAVPSVRELAQQASLCERRFRQLFTAEVGMPPKKYFSELRLQLARELLSGGGYSVKEVSDFLRFCSPFAFSAAFRKRYGIPPSESRVTNATSS